VKCFRFWQWKVFRIISLESTVLALD